LSENRNTPVDKALPLSTILNYNLPTVGMFFLEKGSDTLISVLAFICGLGAGSGAVVAPSIQADVID